MNRDAALEALDRAKEAKLWVRQNQKPGVFGLPPLLEARRLEYGIPDGTFKLAGMYGRILVWQIPQDEGDTFKGTSIIKTERTKDNDRARAPRGIIVAAGLSALDYLRSNGSDLGHIVSFVRLSPYELQVDIVGRGIPQEVKILQAGDIIADEDLCTALRSGECSIVCEDGVHKYRDKNGQIWRPQDPRLAADY